jgi:hypothetical protein
VFIFGTRFICQFSVCAEGLQHFRETVADAAVARLVAAEAGEGAGLVVKLLESEGYASFGIADLGLFFYLGLAANDLGVEQSGLDGPGAIETPAGGDQLLDQIAFVGIAGLKVGKVEIVESLEIFLRFGIEEDAARSEAVLDGGGIGAGAALRGGGTAGKGAIGARSIGAV